jgi:ATP-binding cassette subfamily B protein
MTRVNWDALQLQYLFLDGVPFFLANVFNVIGIAVAMFILDWRLSLLVLIPTPLIIALTKGMLPRLFSLFFRRFRKRRVMNSLINDVLTGMRVVKAFGKEEEEIARFRPANSGMYSSNMDLIRFETAVFPLLALIMRLGGLIVWAVGGWLVVGGNVSFGMLMSFVGYLAMIYEPLQFMTMIADWGSSAMNAAQRIFEIIDTVPEVADRPDPVRLERIKGKIDVRHVTFAYEPNKPVLHDVSFSIKPGEMIGLVGHTGAGKSTITNLITRLYDVDEGMIKIDGVDVRDIAIADLRSQIGIVLQDTYVFNGTIAENISYARPGASHEEIVEAAILANAHDYITKLPDGYDTLLGKKGKDLSGGEKQRLSIARAILLSPRILIFDEATSSVDSRTEQMIQQAIARLIEGRTTIAIAHRLSTLRLANRLVVINKGRVEETGTHEELLRAKGTYSQMVRREREALKVIAVGEE